jgi:hypothetical protein
MEVAVDDDVQVAPPGDRFQHPVQVPLDDLPGAASGFGVRQDSPTARVEETSGLAAVL